MELTLKVTSGKHAGQKLRIPAPKFLIGRGEDCQLRPNSDSVSRHHCVLLVGADGAVVRDLGSRNGTFVNDERITSDRPLVAGDRLTIGQLKFEVVLKPSLVPAPKSVDVIKTAEKAAAAADPGDLDVLELFKEDGGTAMRDTVRMEVSETIATRRELLTEQEQAAPAAPLESAIDEEPHARQRPAPRPQQHKDGGEAAANALRQFLKGR